VQLNPGARVAHYKIVAPLGAGGMGEVYRATDTRLGRDVALKVLPAEMAASAERLERFQREARALAALDHPGIVTVYSVEEHEGVHFLTMQLVEGEPLDRVIPEDGLPFERVFAIAGALAEALNAAHEKGIVHRDLKPANVMVAGDGRVKILDFGLARMTIRDGSSDSELLTAAKTREGVVMGTVQYMSPEQVTGRELDHRTDIFSLGIILYEMASGRRPFHGNSSAELASAILRDAPTPLSELRGNLPERLQRTIERCLQKSADERFSSTRELRDALRSQPGALSSIETAITPAARTESRAEVSGERSGSDGFWIAVLPFRTSGTSAEIGSLAEGLSEDIATGLSRFSYLRVMSRDAGAKSGAGGEQGGARYVMEGNLRQAGAKVRLTVQLVDTASGVRLWAESFDRPFDTGAALEIQDDLTARIVGTCADAFGVLARSISDAVRGKQPDQLTPYEALMRAFGYHHRLTPGEHAEAREALELAVDRAPAKADCWAMLSWLYSHEHSHGFNPRPDSLERAHKAARRAVDLAPTNHLVQQALAVALFFRKEKAACLSAAERALALNPLDTSNEAMFLLTFSGDWDRGTALIRRAMRLNPHHPRWYGIALAVNEYRLGNFRGVVDETVTANVPEIFWSNVLLAAAHAELGELAAADSALRRLLAQKEDFARAGEELLSRWFEPELVGQVMAGLRKAGLEVATKTIASTKSSTSTAPNSGASRAEEGFWTAVLPFRYSGANPDLTALAEGLTEDIVTGLSRFSYLRVIARSSTSQYVKGSVDIREAGRDLGARYVMEGNLRQAGTKLRLAVQLVDAVSGAHIWAENYERAYSPEAVFELQDDLVPRIVSTVADSSGVLPHSISEMLRTKSVDQLSPYEAVLRYFGYLERANPEEHAKARDALERAVETAPDQASCWATLSMVYRDEHTHGFNPRPDPLGRAMAAAQRAVEAAPSHHLGHLALASALFFQGEVVAFRSEAERTLALNPMDSSTSAYLGTLMLHEGDWDRGVALVERARQLNPNHPGWYWFAAYWDAYRKRDYRGALAVALRMNMPGDFYVPAVIAAAYGQLGEVEPARKALQQALAIKPDLPTTARADIAKWFGESEIVDDYVEGLRKAGLEIPASDARSGTADSGIARAEEGFWVAVLPFRCGGGNSDITALADGLTEDIVTGLSRFSYLRVIARSSTSRYLNESVDVRSAGRELGARYMMEGSLRQAGTKLRVAVQLVDATTGAHLWAENYERTFSPESLFEVQDELVPRIVSTVADSNGVLARSMSEAVRSRDAEQLTPYEAVLRSFGYGQRVTPEELTAARSALELAVRKAPAHGDAWAMLAWLHLQDYAQGFNLQADSLTNGLTAARRAVDLASSNHLAWFSLAQALFFHKEFAGFRNAAERAVALNPMDGNSIAFIGELLNYAGDRDRGLALAGRAKQLNPNYPGWYWYADFYDAYRRGDDRAALSFALRINLPGQFFSHAVTAAAYGQLGEADAAGKAVRDLLRLQPDFVSVARKVIEKWWEPEYIERMIDGWRKAGLNIADPEPSSPPAASADAGPAEVSIAVLPFSDMSAAKDQEYLCEGMAEEIMNALVRIEGMRVASRTSAFRAGRDGGDLPSIARALSVNHVLEGSVRTAGDRLRVTAQLTAVGSGYQLWSERFDREAVDVFAVQDEIAAGVVDAVKTRLAPGTRAVQVRPHVHNLDAYRSYLKGRHLRGKEDFFGAMAAFEEAVRLDPAHAPSWTGLAEITVLSAHMGMHLPGAACAAARKMLATAKELQGESADGLHVEAFAAYLERRWEAMETKWRRALEIQPDHVLALGSFAISLCARQRLDEALPLFEKAHEADPLASFPYTLAGWGLLMCGRPKEALRNLQDALTFEKDDASAIGALCLAHVVLRRFDEAIEAGERGVALTHRAPFFLGVLGWALAVAGRVADARAILQELRARPAGSPTPVSEAWLLGALGQSDDAFEVIARAEEEFQGLLSYTGLPGFDSLRGDPRFTQLLQRLELSPG
jgi:TolB-like protein/predicted Zn-dependent protease